MPRMHLLDCMIVVYLILFKPARLPEWLFCFAFPPVLYMWPIFSVSLPTFGIVTIFNFSHSYRYVLISYCDFNSHFPNGYWCWTYFHVPTCHLYILFGVYFLMRVFLFFFQLSFEHSLYIVDTNPTSNMWLTFSHNLYLVFPCSSCGLSQSKSF